MIKKGVKTKEDGAEICYKWRVGAECAEYRYLGCMINKHVESKVTVDSRATAGARALCAWLRRCRVAVGEVQGSHL